MIILLNITVGSSLSHEIILLSLVSGAQQASNATITGMLGVQDASLRCQEADSKLCSRNLELIGKSSINFFQEIGPLSSCELIVSMAFILIW